MNMTVWDTREPPPPGFTAEWEAVLARAPHANFSLTLAYLCWEAQHARHALALIASHGSLRAACVLRRTGDGFVSGWPWRWQAVVDDPGRTGPVGLTPDETNWLFRAALTAARRRRVRFHVPCTAPSEIPAYHAGTTLMYSIDREDGELLASMLPNKRRMIRRAEQKGYVVRETRDHPDLLRFAHLQRETKRRFGSAAPPVSQSPALGHGWQEWELPWMWLLVAEHDGMVESGLGDGLCAGGVLDARAGASTLQARRDGVFALLSLEEARRARGRGYRWINLGGDTAFKREIAGRLATRVHLHCWLGGPGWWTWGVRAQLVWRRTASRVRRTARDLLARNLVPAGVLLLGWSLDLAGGWPAMEIPWA